MKIKEISIHNKNLFLIRDSEEMNEKEWELMLLYLELNKNANTLKYEIIEATQEELNNMNILFKKNKKLIKL